jgi:fumarylacetoacetate (FAA) hydrolase
MKLATLKKGDRDGTLIVVDKELTRAVEVPEIAPTLQAALDRWQQKKSELEKVYENLNKGEVAKSFEFKESDCHSPLPRAYQWADGSAYVNHVELVRKARGAEMPENFWTDPLMYQGGSDRFISPRGQVPIASEEWGIDFESEVAVVTDDVAMGTPPEDALDRIQLFMICNDVSLRNLIPGELSKGFGFFQSKPSSAFSPVAVTPDELGEHWKDGKVHLPLVTHYNDELFGKPEAGEDMTFDFGRLIAHAAKTRPLGPGTIIGSGTVSNLDRSRGSSCLAEKRMLEKIEKGSIETPFMKFGDKIRIEMKLPDGKSIFGTIEQEITPYHYDKKSPR